jgi:hypothetical protein
MSSPHSSRIPPPPFFEFVNLLCCCTLSAVKWNI